MRFRTAVVIGILGCGLALAVLGALAVGSVSLNPVAALRGMIAGGQPADGSSLASAILGLRLARALTGAAVGGLLALAGAILQGLLRNALADPYVLGVSGGGSCVALGALALGLGGMAAALAAAAGATAALAVLFVLAHRALFSIDLHAESGRDDTILLAGTMLASACSAAIAVALAFAPDGRLRTMVFWLMGDLGGAHRIGVGAAAVCVWIGLLLLATRDADAVNRISAGDLLAFTQGVEPVALRRRLIGVAAAAAGIAVSLAGAVGFVGFVAPHLVRRFWGPDARIVLPAASLLGAALVVVADTLARTLVAPMSLPVGALTALVGVPVFLWQLRRPGSAP